MFRRVSAFIIAITLLVGMTSCTMPQDIFSESIGKSDTDGNENSVKELYEFEFTLDGRNYYLPAQFEYFVKDGWSFEQPGASENTADEAEVEETVNENTLLASGKYSNYIDVYKEKYHIEIKFYNDTPTTTALGLCRVVGIRMDALGSSVPFLQFDGEIQFGSSYGEIIKAYGEPSFQKGISSDTGALASVNDMTFDQTAVESSKQVYYYMTKHSFVELTFGLMNGSSDSLINVVIENDTDPEKEYDYKKDREEQPDAIALYDYPDLLGQEVSDFSFKYEKNLYTLPIPVSELIDDGWEFARGASIKVRKGSTEDGVVLKKGNTFIDLLVHNYDTEDFQTPINCYAVSISAGVTGPFVDILMPKGLTIGSNADELQSSYTTPYLNDAASKNNNQAEENLYELTEETDDSLVKNNKKFINKKETDDYIMYSYVMPDDVPSVTIPEEIASVMDPNKSIIGKYRKHIDVYVSKINNKIVYIYMQNCPEYIVDEAAIWAEQLEEAAKAEE